MLIAAVNALIAAALISAVSAALFAAVIAVIASVAVSQGRLHAMPVSLRIGILLIKVIKQTITHFVIISVSMSHFN